MAIVPAFQNPFRRTGATEEEAADAAEEAALVDDAESEWLAYELHEWASQTRAMLAQLLIADEVAHSWQGTTLAHESVEATVDALIEEVEAAENPELDPDEPKVAFEMAEWSGELQAALADRLDHASVPHLFDEDGDLVVHETDEEQVELVIEDLLARAAEEGMEELEGLAINSLLSSMFEADRLRRDVHDGGAVLAAVRSTLAGSPRSRHRSALRHRPGPPSGSGVLTSPTCSRPTTAKTTTSAITQPA